jgi:transcriptional regulator with XRE-family HTH domain
MRRTPRLRGYDVTGSRHSLRVVPPEGFASRLRRERRANDQTQEQLARRFRVRQQTIGAWERGERPQNRFLGELANYLGLDSEQELIALLDRQPGPRPPSEAEDAASAAAEETGHDLDDPDAEAMRMLACQFVQDQKSGALPPAQAADIYRNLTDYFRARAHDR